MAPGALTPRRFAVAIVAPRGYPYARAFREVAETVHHGLLALGHDSVLTTRPGLPGRRAIVFGANTWSAAPDGLAPDAILYNLEQIYDNIAVAHAPPGRPLAAASGVGLQPADRRRVAEAGFAVMAGRPESVILERVLAEGGF